ncbi:MAG TPA: hypothetical protein VE986_01675 [Hyphomicrobiales bacterium]|nr:hypothetical protein [Hyphomicrobiales bacterium]
MTTRDDVDELFRCLLAGIASKQEVQRSVPDQSRQLLSAFSKIDDPSLRQEVVLLVEIVANMPETLKRRKQRWGARMLAQVH